MGPVLVPEPARDPRVFGMQASDVGVRIQLANDPPIRICCVPLTSGSAL
jgi:hypothetical protein